MSRESQRTCASCGNDFSGTMEFCPVCMLRKGLAGDIESGEASVEEAAKPTIPKQAVQRFEHYELVIAEDGKPGRVGSRCDRGHLQGVRRRSALPRDNEGRP